MAGGYENASQQPFWLFRFLEKASTDERSLFLKFVSVSSRLPPGGFEALEYPFTVIRVPLSDELDIDDESVEDEDGDAWVRRAANPKILNSSKLRKKPRA